MSFLQKKTKVNNIPKYKSKPSPTYIKLHSIYKSRKNLINSPKFAGRMSLFVPFSGQYAMKGSMTVEASILLPLLLLFFLHLCGYMEMLRLHSKVGLALWNTGNQLTTYVAAAEALELQVPDAAVSYIYVGNQVKKILGEDYLNTSPLVYGADGLNYLASDYQNDCIDIGVTYQVKPPITIFPFPYMRLVNRYYGKAWIGYDVAAKDIKYVYVTTYGEVWHKTAECSYIYFTIHSAGIDALISLRNADGQKYVQCKLCEASPRSDTIYYTEQGSHYHKDKNCVSLVRYVRAIEWQEKMPYRACSRCVGQEG